MIDTKGGAEIDLKELYAMAADLELALTDTLTAKLRENAHASARRVQDRARALLISQQKTFSRKLANAIKVEEDVANQVVAVVSYPPVGQPSSLPIWNEHGTVHMDARPYMRPAAEEERDRYVQQTEAAIQDAIDELKD